MFYVTQLHAEAAFHAATTDADRAHHGRTLAQHQARLRTACDARPSFYNRNPVPAA